MRYKTSAANPCILLTLALVLPRGVAAGGWDPPPVRLHLSVERSTVRVGERTQLLIEFMDRNYQHASNDRDRLIRFRQTPAGPGDTGVGEIRPQEVIVRAGMRAGPPIAVVGTVPGRLVIAADAEGLMPARTMVFVTQRSASVLSRFLFPIVHAEGNTKLQIYPASQRQPANDKTPAELWVTLEPPPPRGKQLIINVTTDPTVSIEYGHNKRLGFTQVKIDHDNLQSGDIHILTASPGKVRVTARVQQQDLSAEAEVYFDHPRPAAVFFHGEAPTLLPHTREAPVAVQLEDQDKVPITALDREWKILLSSPTDPRVRFEPQTLRLSPSQWIGRAMLRTNGRPSEDQMQLLALDSQSELEPALQTLKVTLATAAYILVLFAGFGGILGGLAQYLYKIPVKQILPKWLDGQLELGLVGNCLLSFLFGLVLFLAAKLGVGVAQVIRPVAPAYGDTPTFAFLFGVLGGFGGVVVLGRLLDRVLPDSSHAAQVPGA